MFRAGVPFTFWDKSLVVMPGTKVYDSHLHFDENKCIQVYGYTRAYMDIVF